MNSTLWKIRYNLNPKAQAVNKAQQQLFYTPLTTINISKIIDKSKTPQLENYIKTCL